MMPIMRDSRLALVALLLAGTLGRAAAGQDTRTVTEPVLPPACTTLDATLATVADSTIADADEHRLDTERIQSAIDGCAAGHAVVLRANGATRAFLAGPIALRAGVTLVVGPRAILFASRDPRLYDLTPGSCGTVTKQGHGCRAFITGDGAKHAGIMGDGAIDGRGWANILGQDVSWWDIARQAQVEKLNQSCPRLIHLTHADDFTLYRITLRNSPNFHVFYDRGDGFTVWGVIINTPKRARNTDAIDPASSTNVTIRNSFIHTGDDDIAIKAGGTGASTHMSILDNHFYSGHGASIGSETNGGASNILVRGLTIQGADNGLRIKSNAARGGLVHDITYEDVCIRDTKNVIEMDAHYSASEKTEGTLIPHFRDIVLRDVYVDGKGKVILDGYDSSQRLGITFDGVTFSDPSQITVQANNTVLTRGPRGTNLTVTGNDVTVSGGDANAAVPASRAEQRCAERFNVPMPVR
jgi:polygalacturonase